MTDSQQTTATLAEMGTDIQQTLQEAMQQTKPALGKMAERMSERLQDLAHQGKAAALETQHKIEDQARQVKTTAEHHIQQAPFKSVMVAAGIGLLVGVMTTWLMRERSH
jgi:ElaB/YqjD/DUF883 family membrane-anchored ribosome-binding protein